jgi:hypothetical protein
MNRRERRLKQRVAEVTRRLTETEAERREWEYRGPTVWSREVLKTFDVTSYLSTSGSRKP